jgi:hypothetical protein
VTPFTDLRVLIERPEGGLACHASLALNAAVRRGHRPMRPALVTMRAAGWRSQTTTHNMSVIILLSAHA